MSPSVLKQRGQANGFTMIEMMIAIFVLTTGLLAAAAVMAKMMTTSQSSRYMTEASTLASEKLEDLTRWDANDPNVCVPAGSSTVGSLTADVTQTTTCAAGGSDTVSYFDEVTMGATDGAFSETISTTSSGSAEYVTTVHGADGSVQTSTSSSPPAAPATFHRRWIIEANSPISGVRRVTVLVTLLDGAVQPPVTFQMSAVRP
jgi:prepilin-type N-terminal cleavage/methylation domain-containing protein